MTKITCLLRTFACLSAAVVPAGLHAQELIANGNFEGASLSPWEVSAPAGSSVATASENSPFLTVFPAGAKSVRVSDDDSEHETPSLKQSFAPQAGIRFSFDFKAPTVAPDSPWYVIWTGEDATTAFFFSIGGQDGLSIGLNQNSVAALEANLWYHVEGTADAPNQIISGAIQNSRGERTTFTGGFPFGVQRVINGVTLMDGDQGRNEPALFDNVSAQAMTVASARLSIAPAPNGQFTVSWTTAGYGLQGATDLGATAQWTDIQTSAQSYTADADQPMQFFRLVQLGQ